MITISSAATFRQEQRSVLGRQMVNRELEQKYKNVTRWLPEFQDAQARVLLEEGVLVPIDRMCAHCHLETGGTGDPKSKSKGPAPARYRCPDPGRSCSPDFYYHGLFQIYWPPFPVNWNDIEKPGYNAYCGAKTLAIGYKACGNNWRNASIKFFSGSCVDVGLIDENTNVDVKQYDEGIRKRISELNEIGIGAGDDNPKVPTPDGTPNTPTGGNCVTVFGKEICKPNPADVAQDVIMNQIQAAFPKLILFAVGIGVLFLGLRAVVNA